MKDRITVLMGAGAMVGFTKVSTDSLTKKILKDCQGFEAFEGCSISVVEFINKLYKRKKGRDANFEIIFHMLEIIRNYRGEKEKYHFNGVENIVCTLHKCLSEIDFKSVNCSLFNIIETINDEIYAYDKKFLCKGKVFKKFFDFLTENNQFCLDVFNLNYDTWVERSLSDYTDGFVQVEDIKGKKISQFKPIEYLKESDRNRVAHLHGQICFGFPGFYEDNDKKESFHDTSNILYKYEKYQDAKKNRQRKMPGYDVSQSDYQIMYSNIITGLFKTDRLLWSPMNVYHSMLTRSILENKNLIIVGYGFSDLYIDKLLDMHNSVHGDNKKIIMIDMKDNNEDGQEPYSSNPFQSSKRKTLYTRRILEKQEWYKDKNMEKQKSDIRYYGDNQVCIYVNGFHEVIKKGMGDVLDFFK